MPVRPTDHLSCPLNIDSTGFIDYCVLRHLVKYREPVVKCSFVMENRGSLKTPPSAIHSVGDSVVST